MGSWNTRCLVSHLAYQIVNLNRSRNTETNRFQMAGREVHGMKKRMNRV